MEEKKIVLVYADWIELFEALNNEEAGKLIKHFFRYVNDLNPEYPDRLTELSFIPIKQSLKRDLEKWIGTKEERSYNGRKGNLRKYNPDLFDRFLKEEITLEEAESIAKTRKMSPPDKKHRIAISSVANVAVNVNDNVNDIISFEWFWNTYDKKVDRTKCESKFKNLSNTEKEKIKEVLPAYVKSKLDIQYRKNPLTWLNGKCWNDEITEAPTNNPILTQKSIDEFDWDNVGLGSVLPNGAIITPDVVHIHESTGLSYRKLSSL